MPYCDICGPYTKYCKIDRHSHNGGCSCCYPCIKHTKSDKVITPFDGTVVDWRTLDWDSFDGKSVCITCRDGNFTIGKECYNAEDYCQIWLTDLNYIPRAGYSREGAIINKKDITRIIEVSCS